MTDLMGMPAVSTALALHWDLHDATVEPHGSGMNSRTWLVDDGQRRWVAKAVPTESERRFASGLSVASLVEAAGIPSGAPEPTTTGALSASIGDHTLALLRFVDGEPLVGDDTAEQQLIGSTLAAVHRVLAGKDVRDAERFHWLDADLPHLHVEAWLRPAIRDAIAVYEALSPGTLTWGLLHTDPAPEAFILDRGTGMCGLIDWDFGLVGPLMYDVASAVMYVGGPERATALLDAYAAEAVVGAAEVARALEPMLRIRWAVQADYFARRIASNDLTGIAAPDENQKGLEDARRALFA